MKIKKIIAAFLCAAQLLGVGAVFAEEQAPTAASVEEQATATVEETGEEGELPLGENEIRIYVSADGSDSADGSFANPLKTVEKGISTASELIAQNPNKNVVVAIRGGEYRIKQTIKLDSNQNGLTIKAYNGEEVRLLGSTKLTKRFKQLEDEAALQRFSKEVQQYIGVYDLTELGALTAYTPASGYATRYYEFIVDDTPQTLAQYPNTGFDRTETVSGTTTFTGKDSASRVSRWKNETDAYAEGYFGVEWATAVVKIKEISGKSVVMDGSPYYGLGVDNRYRVWNIMAELDSPGEFYIDTTAKKLYYYPPYPLTSSTLEVTSLSVPMFQGNNVKDITFDGISIMNTRNDAIELDSSKNITVKNCTFKNIGVRAIELTNSTDCVIQNNSISEIGANAITISGGDRTTLTPSNNLIDNNHIYDFAQFSRTNTPGIQLDGVGTTITNNLIHGSPAQGILFTGNDHKMMYNEFYDLVNEACDAGAIYSGRNYTWRGNEIAYNYFHDIDTIADKGGSIYVAGVYYDDLMSSVNTHHNVFYKCNLAVMIGGGRDHNFDNNIILDCDTGMFMDGRGVGWGAYHALPPTTSGTGMAYNTIFEVPYDKEPWASKYPELASIFDGPEKLGIPNNNSIQGNILYNCLTNTVASEMIEYGTVTNNYEVSGNDKKADGVDPETLFEDYAGRNFAIKDGSELAKKYPEAAKIDMSEIGLREDMAAKEGDKAEKESFRVIYPWNGTKEVSNLGQTFSWEKNGIASKYIVEIADDPTMENVILSYETLDTTADIALIPSGGKPYWWTVKAVNQSQSLSETFDTFTQDGPPRLIISSTTEKLDKTQLKKNITTLTKLEAAVVEGTTPGTYKKGFKEKVTTLLNKANSVNNSSTVLQKDVIEVNNEYDALISSVKDYINYEVFNLGDAIKDQSNWSYREDHYTFGDDGTLTLIGPDGERINHYQHMVYDVPLGDNVAVKFGYKVNVSSNYCIIALQNGSQVLGGGYNLIIKSSAIEIQKRIEGTPSGNNYIQESVLNFYISDNKWVDLELGVLKTGIGSYVYLMADGQMVADFFDTETPYWTGESRFVFGNPSGESAECYAAIRAAKE